MTILENIVERTGKTKKQIAIDLNCSRSTVYNWLREPKTMTVQDIEDFAKVVRKKPRYIFSLITNGR